MKTYIYVLCIIQICNILSVKIKQIDENKLEIPEIIHNSNTIIPEYVKTNKESQMKTPLIIQPKFKENQDLERPNYLSSVINSYPTSVSTKHNKIPDMTFDLDMIKKSRMLETTQTTPPNMFQFTRDNIPPIGTPVIPNDVPKMQFSQIPLQQYQTISQIPNYTTHLTQSQFQPTVIQPINSLPVPNPVPMQLHDNLPTLTTFNMPLTYKGEVMKPKIPDLSDLERKINNVDKLLPKELNELINDLKYHEKAIKPMAEDIYKRIKKYENQNSILLDSLKDDVIDSSRQLNSLIIEVPIQERQMIIEELKDEFTRSLMGYSVDKNKYLHIKDLDPKEIMDISNMIKKQLDSNDQFYLQGDYILK